MIYGIKVIHVAGNTDYRMGSATSIALRSTNHAVIPAKPRKTGLQSSGKLNGRPEDAVCTTINSRGTDTSAAKKASQFSQGLSSSQGKQATNASKGKRRHPTNLYSQSNTLLILKLYL